METEGTKSGTADASASGDDRSQHGVHPASPRQIAANRRNALRSTGPRTPVGKLTSKFNATKHGLSASEIVIPGRENADELESLRAQLREEWAPEGPTEVGLVHELADIDWRLRRAHRAELGHTRRGMEISREYGALRDPRMSSTAIDVASGS
jgi:hypothetical protein